MSKHNQSGGFKQGLAKGVTAGVVGTGLAMIFVGGGMEPIPTIIGNVPAPIVLGAGVGIGSAVAELGHQYVLPHIHVSKRYQDTTAMIASPLMAGAGGVGAMYLLTNGNVYQWPTLFAISAAGDVGGHYLYESLIKNYI